MTAHALHKIDNFIKDAVFSDETKQFVSPYDPNAGDAVTFTLRVAANVDCQAFFCVGTDTESLPMKGTTSDGVFNFFTVEWECPAEPVRYFYKIIMNGQVFFYNKQGLTDFLTDHYHFRLVPGLQTPDWTKGAVMYQIFVDRFYNGDPANDVQSHEYAYLGITAKALPWHSDIAVGDFCNFYGGDLQGVMDKMAYLQDLGVEAIYLNPVFVSPSSHKYDAQDYDYIDPHFGVILEDGGDLLRFEHVDNKYATKYKKRTTHQANLEAGNRLMVKLIEKAHAHGIKVIMDGVFNHCGSFHKWLDAAGFYKGEGAPGAYWAADSPFHNYFVWHGSKPTDYAGWWDNANHPKLNYEDSPALFEYMMEVGKKWVSPPYNADGWRLDVAADLGRSMEMNRHFWESFRNHVKAANPDAVILAEHYGDPSGWLNGKGWDTVMNYDAFMEPVSWFFTGVSKHSEEACPHLKNDGKTFESTMRYHKAYMHVHALQSAMNQLSNHDHSRFLTRTNGNIGRWHTVGAKAAGVGVDKNIMMAAMVFQMTWTGAPTIYYGDEAGLVGWTDPDNRRPFPWGREDGVLTGLYRALAGIRRRYPALRHGSAEFLLAEGAVLSFGRWDDRQKLVVAINNGDKPLEVMVPVWRVGLFDGCMDVLLVTGGGVFYRGDRRCDVSGGEVKLALPGKSAVVLGV